MLISACGFTTQELRDALAIIRKKSAEELAEDIRKMSPWVTQDSQSTNSPRLNAESIYEQVISLINAAGISKTAASQSMAKTLKKRFPGKKIPPYNQKSGFFLWLNSLAQSFSESEILFSASNIRHDTAGNFGDDDWLNNK